MYQGCTGILNFSGSHLAKYSAVRRFKELKKNRLSMEAQKSVLIISWGGVPGVYRRIYIYIYDLENGVLGLYQRIYIYIYIRKNP